MKGYNTPNSVNVIAYRPLYWNFPRFKLGQLRAKRSSLVMYVETLQQATLDGAFGLAQEKHAGANSL